MSGSGSQYKLIVQAHLDESQVKKQFKKMSKSAKINVDTKGAAKNVDKLSNSIGNAVKKTVEWAIAVGAVYGAINQLKDGIEFISDLNNSMTQIQMVSGMTAEETAKLSVEYNGLAKELSATTLEVSNGALEWVKQGKTAEEAAELTRISIMTSKLAMIDSAKATEYLTSVMNGFKLETEDMIGVMDKLVAIDNESATSVEEVALALQRSSSTAMEAGVTFDELVSYIATVSSVTRKSASSIGESFKTMFSRMQSVKLGSSLDEFGEDISNVETSLRNVGIEVRDSIDEFKPMGQVVDEIAQKWDNLTEVQRAQIAEAIAGKRQRENFLVLMNNYNDSLEYQAIATEAAGMTLERYAIRQEMVAAKADLLRATWESLWIETLNADTIKRVYDFATGLLEVAEEMGGLSVVLGRVIFLWSLLNIELIATKAIAMGTFFVTMIGNLSVLPSILSMIVAQYGGWAIAGETLNIVLGTTVGLVGVLTGGIIILIAATVKLVGKLKELKLEQEEGLTRVDNAWKSLFNRMKEEGADVEEIFNAYKRGLDVVAEGYENATAMEKDFIDKQRLMEVGLDNVIAYIEETASSYDEYIDALEKVAELHGVEVSTIAKTRDEYENLTQHLHSATRGFRGFRDEVSATSEELETAASIIEGLQDKISSMTDIAAGGSDISYDEIVELSKVYDNYLDLLDIEGGLVKLNTDKLREMNIEKAQAEVETAKLNGKTEKEIALLENYVDQLERAVPMSREYVNALQEIMSAEEVQGSNLAGIAYEIAEISHQYERGLISATTYFDEINSRLESIDIAEMFAEDQEAANVFFAGIAQDASASLMQISSMFDAGEISIVEYTEQLGILSETFGSIGQMAMDSGMLTSEAMGVVGEAISSITSGTERLMNLQELNTQVQNIWAQKTAENLQWGTQAYNDYMQDVANAAIQTGEVFTDLSGNAFTNADDLYGYLTASESNFATFSDQTANTTGKVIEGIVHSVGGMLVKLGDAISGFEGEITITPTPGGMVDFPIGILGQEINNALQIPSIGIDIGSGGFAQIGSAVSGFGESLQGLEFNFDSGIYTDGMNQVTDSVGGASSAYNDLTNSINNATGAQQGLNDAVDDFKQKQIDALNAQLNAYGRIIDKRKELLKTMLDEKNYQDDIEAQQKSIADIRNELLDLALDDSEEARKKRLELEAELELKEKDLADTQYEQGIDRQISALDADYSAFEDYIKGIIDMIKLMEVDTEAEFLKMLLENPGFIPTQGVPMPPLPQLYDPVFGSASGTNAALSGMNNGMFDNMPTGGFIPPTIPSSGGFVQPDIASGQNGSVSVENLIKISVAGNLDDSVIPDIKLIAKKVVGELNKDFLKRGITRGATRFSV